MITHNDKELNQIYNYSGIADSVINGVISHSIITMMYQWSNVIAFDCGSHRSANLGNIQSAAYKVRFS